MTTRAQPHHRRPARGRRLATALATATLLLVGTVPLTPVARGAVILLVETTSDAEFPADGLCSLRAAIVAANIGGFAGYCDAGSNEQDSIRFSLGAGVPVISVGANLPTITQGVTINGSTGGATRVRIHGPGTGNGTGVINSGAGTYIRNLEIDAFGIGISNSGANVTIVGSVIGPNQLYGVTSTAGGLTLGGTTGVTPGGPCTGSCNVIGGHGFGGISVAGGGTVLGNFIGTDAAGTGAQSNGYGLFVSGGTWAVGGTEPGAGNVISGNNQGMAVTPTCVACVVEGNRIGTNAAGTAAIPNNIYGLAVSGPGARVGGTAPGAGNIISGNVLVGIKVENTDGTVIQGNRIGVGAFGNALGNGSNGISIGGGGEGVDGVLVGSGIAPAGANVIAHNGGAGIGVFPSTYPVHHVEVRRNSIHANGGAAILHDGTVNDGIDPPVLTGLGPVTGTSCANCTIEVYSDDLDEGRIYEGSVTADLGGNWTYLKPVVGPNVKATATDGAHNTSALAAPFAMSSPFTDTATSPFEDEIEWLYANGITTGCSATKYCPSGTVTREQMASFLVRMFRPPTTGTDFFTDDEQSSHETNINRLAAAGITTGCGATTFCPKGLVSREQMASFIARAAELTVGAGRDYFNDDDASSHEPNIDRIAAAGITTGCGTFKYCPPNSVTREQMAAFLYRILVPADSPPHPAP